MHDCSLHTFGYRANVAANDFVKYFIEVVEINTMKTRFDLNPSSAAAATTGGAKFGILCHLSVLALFELENEIDKPYVPFLLGCMSTLLITHHVFLLLIDNFLLYV